MRFRRFSLCIFRGACLLAGSLFFCPPVTADEPSAAVRFVSWNLRNYLLTAVTPEPRAAHDTKPKPAEDVAAVTRILKELKPDVLGVSEIGGPEDLAALQARLKEAGFDLPHREHVIAADRVRHLGLLSRFPITARQSQTSLSYLHDETRLPVQRGFLDLTLQITPSYQLRCVGVHLKSRLATPEADENLMRRNEAHLLRLHTDTILTADPETNLLVYGDFNDTRDQPSIRAIPGPRGAQNYLTAITPADTRGDRWTYFYPAAETYSRIDYFFASRSLMPEVEEEQCTIYSGPDWFTASDHRALCFVLTPREKQPRVRKTEGR